MNVDFNVAISIMKQIQETSYPKSKQVEQFIEDVIEHFDNPIVGSSGGLDNSLEEIQEYIQKLKESPEKSLQLLIKAGIIDENKKLRPPYRGEES